MLSSSGTDETAEPRTRHIFTPFRCLIFSLGLLQNYRLSRFIDFDWPKEAVIIESWPQARVPEVLPGSVAVPLNPPPWYIQLP